MHLSLFLKTKKEEVQGGSGKGKAVVTKSTAVVQLAGTAAGSSKEAGGSSSGQGQRQHQILMDPTKRKGSCYRINCSCSTGWNSSWII